MKYKILVLHACCCIIFGVFEFKFMFEFMCMIVFLNRKNNSFSSSSPSSLLLVFLFWPKNSEVQRRPSYSFPAAAANPAAQQPSRPPQLSAQLRPAHMRRRPLSLTRGARVSSPSLRRPQPGFGAAVRLRLGYASLVVAHTPWTTLAPI
jgi:hypothetical protein